MVVGREIVPVAVHKMHKKKENNAFEFLQAIVFIYDVCIYKMCRIRQERKKKKKVLRNLFVCSEMKQIKQVREAIIALGFLSRKIIICLGFYFELLVLD